MSLDELLTPDCLLRTCNIAMQLIRFVRVLFLSFLVCVVLTKPVESPEPQIRHAGHDLNPRLYEEILNDRWHMQMETIEQFILPRFAFWGFRYFLHSLASRMADDFSTRPPCPHYSFTMGSLVLHAESITDQPIAWATMEWLVGRLNTWVANEWPGGEVEIWLEDQLFGDAVFVSLKVLLDRPLHRSV